MQFDVDLELPWHFRKWLDPYRYKIAFGGRGGTKSWTVARLLASISAGRKLEVLCAREFQNSIEDSVHRLLENQIGELGLDPLFDIQKRQILSVAGSRFVFKGLHRNVQKIKSLEDTDIVWVEDAEKVSHDSWEKLIPTIRKPGSEIWVTFNPDEETDPTYQRFIIKRPPRTLVIKINSTDNPWLSNEMKAEREYLKRTDPDAYAHVWLGECRKGSDAQILHGKWKVRPFTPGEDWLGPYFGGDWGFAQDPTVLIKCWIYQRRLFIERESYGVRIELGDIPGRWMRDVPDCEKYAIRADSARPETISLLSKGVPTRKDPTGQSNCLPRLEAVEKWKGSVEDGISFLRGYFEEIVIHDRCTHTAQEARLYSYKTDPLTGDVLPIIIDAHNHTWDSVRYALAPVIKAEETRELKVLA